MHAIQFDAISDIIDRRNREYRTFKWGETHTHTKWCELLEQLYEIRQYSYDEHVEPVEGDAVELE